MSNKIRIDIGLSYSAPCSFDWLKKSKDLIVYGFEPSPKNIESIKKLEDFKIFEDRFKLFEFGLSDYESDEEIFYETEVDSGCSSFYKPNENLLIPYNAVKAKIRNANIIFEKIDSTIELIKTDTQGNDFKIIKAIENNLHKVVFLDVELFAHQYNLDHDYENQKFIDFIESKNFKLLNITNGNGRFFNKKFINEIQSGMYNNDTIEPFD